MGAALRRTVVLCAGFLGVGLMGTRTISAAATTGIQSPYLSTADSPLVIASPGYKLEDFEPSTPTLPLLGVNLTTLHGSSVDPGLSVDADDGSIDGSGAAGNSLTVTTQAGTTGATFTFNNITLGGYPKSAGVAVTAAGAFPLLFTVFDTSNAVSGTYTIPSISTSSPTSDDFLFWASDAAGISAISVSSSNATFHLHLDHLQLDTVNTISVPEPATSACAIVGAAILLTARRRRQS
jgi:hypothetical protein